MGGAIREWVSGRELSPDIDIVGTCASDLQHFREINFPDAPPIQTTSDAVTYQPFVKPVQLLKYYQPTLEEHLKRFDFTICQFGWDGTDVWATPDALRHLESGDLVFANAEAGRELNTLRRAFKYAQKGFLPNLANIYVIASKIRGLQSGDLVDQLHHIESRATYV